MPSTENHIKAKKASNQALSLQKTSTDIALENTSLALKDLKIVKSEDIEPTEILKKVVNSAEQLSDDIVNKVSSTSLKQFLAACQNVKRKIEECEKIEKESTSSPKIPTPTDKLMDQINVVIDLSNQAKECGLITESMEDFVGSCVKLKEKLQFKEKEDRASNQVLVKLRRNLELVKILVNQMENEGIITHSLANLIKNTEGVKTEINMEKKYPNKDAGLNPESGHTSIELSKKPQEKVVFQYWYNNKEDVEDLVTDLPETPCMTNESNAAMRETKESIEKVCDTCWNAQKEASVILPVDKLPNGILTVDNLGCFKDKQRKIIRIRTFTNPDGTTREEKETIVIRKRNHDPNKMTMNDDEWEDTSIESVWDDNKSQRIEFFVNPHLNQLGFLSFSRRTTSESMFINACEMTQPSIKRYASFRNLYSCLSISNASSESKLGVITNLINE